MKKLLLALALLSASAFAQSNMFAAGVSYNPSGSPSVAGTGLYAHTLTDGTMAFTIADAIPSTVKPFTVNVNMGAGIAQRVFSIGKVPIYIPTSAGVSLNGSNTGWSWSTGAMTAFRYKQSNWYIMPILRVSKSSVSGGSGYVPIFGILFAFGE